MDYYYKRNVIVNILLSRSIACSTIARLLTVRCVIPGAAPVGLEARPAAAIVNSLVCVRTGLPLTSA